MIRTLLRTLVLPGLAGALLAGCATGYDYRGGPGDYYYGQPEVEYRDQGWYGGYGVYGGYGGAPYGYYGDPYPYYYGGGYPYYPYWDPYWVRPPHRHHDDPPAPPPTSGPAPPPRWRDHDYDDRPPPRAPNLQRPPVMLPAPPRSNPAPRFVPRESIPREPREHQERDSHRKTLP